MPRPPKTWKAVERAVARLLGGRRCHFEGQDVETGDWAVEIKHGKQVPRTVPRWYRGSAQLATHNLMIPTLLALCMT